MELAVSQNQKSRQIDSANNPIEIKDNDKNRAEHGIDNRKRYEENNDTPG
jgi:hypothetical protein